MSASQSNPNFCYCSNPNTLQMSKLFVVNRSVQKTKKKKKKKKKKVLQHQLKKKKIFRNKIAVSPGVSA
jgi:hypothetical protein